MFVSGLFLYDTLPLTPALGVVEKFTFGLFCLQSKHSACECFLTEFFYREGVVSTSTNPQSGGPPLVGCPRLLIQFISSYPPYRRSFLCPQPEDATFRGDRDPLHGLHIVYLWVTNTTRMTRLENQPIYQNYVFVRKIKISFDALDINETIIVTKTKLLHKPQRKHNGESDREFLSRKIPYTRFGWFTCKQTCENWRL